MAHASLNSQDSPAGAIPEHTRPNISRLEAFRAEVALARKRRWPFRAIATMLAERHGLTISPRAICGFCKCRGIEKGIGETRNQQPEVQPEPQSTAPMDTTASLKPRPRRKKKPFVYTEGPLKTHANGLLKDE